MLGGNQKSTQRVFSWFFLPSFFFSSRFFFSPPFLLFGAGLQFVEAGKDYGASAPFLPFFFFLYAFSFFSPAPGRDGVKSAEFVLPPPPPFSFFLLFFFFFSGFRARERGGNRKVERTGIGAYAWALFFFFLFSFFFFKEFFAKRKSRIYFFFLLSFLPPPFFGKEHRSVNIRKSSSSPLSSPF